MYPSVADGDATPTSKRFASCSSALSSDRRHNRLPGGTCSSSSLIMSRRSRRQLMNSSCAAWGGESVCVRSSPARVDHNRQNGSQPLHPETI